MSLIVSNLATDKQLKLLKELGYEGQHKISQDLAAEILNELFDKQKYDQSSTYIEFEGTHIEIY